MCIWVILRTGIPSLLPVILCSLWSWREYLREKGFFLSSWGFILLSAQYKEERWHTVEGACWCAYEVGGKESRSSWGSSSWLGVCVSSVQKNKIYKDLFLQRIVLTKVLAIEFCTAAGLLPSLAWEIITSAGMIVWLKESTD